MSRSRSQKAARFGALAERIARERYDLDADRDDWHDARGPDGRPWDVKAAMLSRYQPRFRLWREQHQRLRSESGGYVFIGYRPNGSGIVVEQTRTLRARSLRLDWGGAGAHPKGDQAKVAVSRIF